MSRAWPGLTSLVTLLTLATASACAVDEPVEPVDLVNASGDDKADGAARLGFALGPTTPMARARIRCSEIFSCDVELEIATPLSSLRPMYEEYFRSRGGSLLDQRLYSITITSDALPAPHVTLVENRIQLRDEVVFSSGGWIYHDDVQRDHVRLHLDDPRAIVNIEIRMTDELLELGEDLGWPPTLAGKIKATWW